MNVSPALNLQTIPHLLLIKRRGCKNVWIESTFGLLDRIGEKMLGTPPHLCWICPEREGVERQLFFPLLGFYEVVSFNSLVSALRVPVDYRPHWHTRLR